MLKIILSLLVSIFLCSPSILAADYVNFLNIQFKSIPAGSFYMGSCKPKKRATEEKPGFFGFGKKSICPSGGNPDKGAEADEQPQHLVSISSPFQIGVYEVTLGQYMRYIQDSNLTVTESFKKHNSHGEDAALVWISWFQVNSFINWLNANKPADDRGTYRLPTEAEWEYVARAGTTDPYFFGTQKHHIGRYAWTIKHSQKLGQIWSQPVGKKLPNPWGIYDIYGNVWEWVYDVYQEDYYANSPAKDPKGPNVGPHQVVRGCSLYTSTQNCRSAKRHYFAADKRDGSVGFRLVRELP